MAVFRSRSLRNPGLFLPSDHFGTPHQLSASLDFLESPYNTVPYIIMEYLPKSIHEGK